MLHPASAHFAIVLPIVALVFALAYHIKPSEIMSKISTRLMVVALLFMGIAWYFGAQDGPDVYILLNEEGQALLKEHKNNAPYLFFSLLAATALKFFGCLKKRIALEGAAAALLLAVVAGTLYQGNIGGKIVYEHAGGVEVPEEYCEDF